MFYIYKYIYSITEYHFYDRQGFRGEGILTCIVPKCPLTNFSKLNKENTLKIKSITCFIK